MHAPGMPGTFSPPPGVSNPDMHHCTCVTHVPWCMPESLTSGFLWSAWRGKRSRHSQRMCNPQFYASGKRSIRLYTPSVVRTVFVVMIDHGFLRLVVPISRGITLIHWGRVTHICVGKIQSLVQIMACRLFGAKPSSEPVWHIVI